MGRSFFEQFLDDYFAESEEHLTSARSSLIAIDVSNSASAVDAAVVDDLLRNFHSLKGLSAMVGVDEATQLSHHIEDYLRELKHPQVVPSAEGIECVLAGIDTIERVLAARRKSEPPPEISDVLLKLEAAIREARSIPGSAAAPAVRNWLFEFKPSAELASHAVTVSTVRDLLREIGHIVSASPRVLSDGGVAFEFVVSTSSPEKSFQVLASQGIRYSPAPEEERAPASAPAPGPAYDRPGSQGAPLHLNVVRVEMSRLDNLMRLVGELVISRFRLDETLRAQSWAQLQEINVSMERQLRELREGVMRVRMVPIGQIFERMRFVVRGLEREVGKRVEVEIQGQDTELDKVIVETMMDPLLHLVRNAVSHGLETPEERAASGKPPAGVVQLKASTSGDTVLVEVRDDGKGVDLAKIAARARSLGLIGPRESLDPSRVLDVISTPGFTTRDHADLASGRGVGMAAVKSAVAGLGGSMTMETTPGRGTAFAIRLPLTVLIADSLLVTVAQQRFAVPQSAVQEVLSIEAAAVRTLENNEIVPFRQGVLPILRLRKFFGLSGAAPDRMHLLVVGNEGSPVGLVVDRITGQREIVVRAASDPLLKAPGVVGATELGDGRPVLILDPNTLIRAARA